MITLYKSMYAIILIGRSHNHQKQLNSNRNQANNFKTKTLNSQINIHTDRNLAHLLRFGSTITRSKSNPCIHRWIVTDPKSKPLDSDLN